MTLRVIWKSLAMVTVLLSAWGIQAQAQPLVKPPAPAGDKVAATVNGEKIMESEVRAILVTWQPPLVLPVNKKKELEQRAVTMLIDDALMRQFLRKNAPAATPQEIQKKLDDVTAELKRKGTTLEEYLGQASQTLDQFKAEIAGVIQWENYLTKQIPEATAKTYYETNKPHFDKILVRASHILVQAKAGASADEKKAAQQKIETIRQEVVSGKIDFASAAKKYSDCAASKDQGGDIGFFRYKFVVVDPIAKAAFNAKVGDITTPVTTDFGFHILKISDRTRGDGSNFDSIKDVVREVCAQDNEWYQLIINNERKGAKIEIFLQ